MNKMKTSSILGIFLLVSVLVVGLTGVASAFDNSNSQTWDFDDNDVMYKPPHSEDGTLAIGTGSSNIWTSQHDAEVDYQFETELWSGQLECTNPSSGKKLTVEIGIWDGSSFASKKTSAEYTLNHNVGEGIVYSLGTVNTFTVPTGDWLAARVTNTGTGSFTLITDGSCFISYPPDDPAYPYPELSTLVLLSFGLLALAGFVVYSRRRNNKK
jgi:hypothetical protein